MTIRRILVALVVLLLALPAVSAGEEQADKMQAKRSAIDTMARDTLDRLFSENPRAKGLYEASAGYAVFDSVKVAVLVSGGGGVGVAVDKNSGQRTYMKMGTAGVGVGLGGQSYQVVFFFEDQKAMNKFVQKGWAADASANAAAGKEGANVDSSFMNGFAVFQLTNKGLMANADISGTKYWKHKKLN